MTKTAKLKDVIGGGKEGERVNKKILKMSEIHVNLKNSSRAYQPQERQRHLNTTPITTSKETGKERQFLLNT